MPAMMSSLLPNNLQLSSLEIIALASQLHINVPTVEPEDLIKATLADPEESRQIATIPEHRAIRSELSIVPIYL